MLYNSLGETNHTKDVTVLEGNVYNYAESFDSNLGKTWVLGKIRVESLPSAMKVRTSSFKLMSRKIPFNCAHLKPVTISNER